MFLAEIVHRGVSPIQAADNAVDDGAERFHEVVREAERIILVVMVQPDGGVKPGGAACAGGHRAQDGIPVVEQEIAVLNVPVTPERVFEKILPVDDGGAPLQIIRVAGTNLLRKLGQSRV